MAASDKKVRKDQKKRERAKRDLARHKRRLARTANEERPDDESSDEVQYLDAAHTNLIEDFFGNSPDSSSQLTAKPQPENAEIEQWWDQYLKAGGPVRLAMIRGKIDDELDQQWREALFPEAVFEAEQASESDDYVGLLELLANEHRGLYDLGSLWFLRSRVSRYLLIGDSDAIVNAVEQDAAALTETHETYYGIMSMLRLAGLSDPADTLAKAGMRVINHRDLMPWAVGEIAHFLMDAHVRQCVTEGGDASSVADLESFMEDNDFKMDPEVVLLRAEMIRRLTGRTKTKWMRNQLLGTNRQSREHRYLLSFEFSHWLTFHRDIAPIAADELRGLVMETLSDKGLTMRSYFDGLSKTTLDKHLAGLLGFMSLDRFKAPATLIAVRHFVSFLDSVGLVKPAAMTRSIGAIEDLDGQLRRLLKDEWSSFTFLDPLRTAANPHPSNED